MGQLVFQTNGGGQVNLVGPTGSNASTFNINVPAVNGNVVTTGDTGTVTNTMLASSAYAVPGTIGSTTPNTGAFTTLTASTSVVSPIHGAASGSALSLQSNGTTNATLDTSGNLGIGTSSPSYKVDTSGTGVFGSAGGITLTTATNTIGIRGSSATTAESSALHFGDNYNTSSRQWAVINGYTAQGALSFLVSSAENTNPAVSGSAAMTLDANGNLLVGTTSSPSGSGNIQAPTIYSSTTASIAYVAVSSSGLLQRGGISALKYKQDIRDLEYIDIDLFRPVRYKSKCEGDDQTIDHFGFIADEVDAKGIKELVVYNDGEIEGFAYDRMTAVLVKEVQSLRARVAQLEAKGA
jgi:hypothetical protein